MSDRPEPIPTPLDEAFWEGCTNHELRMQRCEECGYVRWPPSPVCPECWSDVSVWSTLSGNGTLVSWVVFHVGFLPAFEESLPYIIVEVELEEGPRYLAPLAGDFGVDELSQGMVMQVTFTDQGEFTLPAFEPVDVV